MRHILKHFFTYACTNIGIRCITLLATPYMLSLISPADYGNAALLTSTLSIATIISGLGLRQALSLEYFHYNLSNRIYLIQGIVHTYVRYSLPVSTLILVITLLPIYFYCTHIICITIASILFIHLYFFVELLYQIVQYEHKSRLYALLQSCTTLSTTFFTLMFLWLTAGNFISMLYAQCMSMGGLFLFGLYRYIKFPIPIKYTHKNKKDISLTQGLPFIPSMLFAWFLTSGNRWVLAFMISREQLGTYALAETIGQLFQTCILIPWSGSYLPYILNCYKKNPALILYTEQWNQRIMIRIIGTLSILTCIGYWLGKSLFFMFIPTSYHSAYKYILPITLGNIILLGTYFASTFIQFHKKKYFLSCSLCIPALSNLVLTYFLVTHYQAYGCALAHVCSQTIYFSLTLTYNWYLQYSLSQKIKPGLQSISCN